MVGAPPRFNPMHPKHIIPSLLVHAGGNCWIYSASFFFQKEIGRQCQTRKFRCICMWDVAKCEMREDPDLDYGGGLIRAKVIRLRLDWPALDRGPFGLFSCLHVKILQRNFFNLKY